MGNTSLNYLEQFYHIPQYRLYFSVGKFKILTVLGNFLL